MENRSSTVVADAEGTLIQAGQLVELSEDANATTPFIGARRVKEVSDIPGSPPSVSIPGVGWVYSRYVRALTADDLMQSPEPEPALDVNNIIEKINTEYERGEGWEQGRWPNDTVKLLADEIVMLRNRIDCALVCLYAAQESLNDADVDGAVEILEPREQSADTRDEFYETVERNAKALVNLMLQCPPTSGPPTARWQGWTGQ